MGVIKVSVVVPAYNIEKYIKRCLSSVSRQSLMDIEIIVVNDGSTDSTLAMIKEMAKDDSRIVVVNKANGGLSSARNAGIEVAKGEYIANIDGDDWIETDCLQSMYVHAKKNNLDVVICDYWKDYDNGQQYKVIDLPTNENEIFYKDQWFTGFFERNATQSMVNKLFKAALYKENNIRHPEQISVGEDLATTPRLIWQTNKIGKINKAYYHYIQRPNSLINGISRENTDKTLVSLMKTFDVLNEYFAGQAHILQTLAAHRIGQIAIFIFTAQVDKNSEMMQLLTREYLDSNRYNDMKYSTTRIQVYSQVLQCVPSYYVLRVIQFFDYILHFIYVKAIRGQY